MNRTIPLKAIGWLSLVVVPVAIIGIAFLYFFSHQSVMLLLTALLGLLYTVYLFNNMEFGPQYIRRVKVPKAPADIERLLKTTDHEGDLIYVYLLSAFADEEESLSKSDMHRWIQKKGHIDLTYQATLPYIENLENQELIASPKVARDYEYILTPKGKWCAEAIHVCFPHTYFWFLIRHSLGLRPLKDYPS